MTHSYLVETMAMIGAGRMATALARGYVQSGLLASSSIVASDPSPTARAAFEGEVPGVRFAATNGAAVSSAEVVMLAVKPQQIVNVLSEIGDTMRREALVVSIAAGVPLSRLADRLPSGQRIVRVMPNTPCLIGRGAAAYSLGQRATAEDSRLMSQLLSAVGVAHEVPEAWLDAVTGLSGSGPAFVYTMIEQLAAGGVQAGLPADLAADLAVRTVSGAAEMVLATGQSPAVLRDRVTSPGGTTLAGLTALEREGFERAVVAAVEAATRRSAELGSTS